jgi:thermolysin
VFGGDLTREFDNGEVVSVYGQLYSGLDLDVSPTLAAFDAKTIAEGLAGAELGPARVPALVVLPLDDGRYVLAYDIQVMAQGRLTRYFIDAKTGQVAFEYDNLQTQTASVGRATGVYEDSKKLSGSSQNGTFLASDLLRPPAIYTYDMKNDYARVDRIVNGLSVLQTSDIATDSDNVWTDGPVVDAHVYAGYTYDYYYQRMGRKGLNDNNLTMRLLVHPINRNSYATLYSSEPDYFSNAFWDGYEMVFGEGFPSNVTLGGSRFTYFSASIDVVAHELTHGVTQYTSNLTYRNESGALNEAFSDIMGTSVEFFKQPRASDVVNGSGTLKADYLLAEDVASIPFRSMANPAAFGDPDHYSQRYTGTSDNGGVHINSGIANQAFYLAIEGGTNRTSGRAVTGVGAANRDQVEKVFYRAFAFKLTSNATFSMARSATIQAARELYGRGSAAETAIIQAWDAVGVDVGINPTMGPSVDNRPAARATVGTAVRKIR